MRFRRAGTAGEDDVIIDLRERLAPYGDAEEEASAPAGRVTEDQDPSGWSTRPSPRHLAPPPRHLAPSSRRR